MRLDELLDLDQWNTQRLADAVRRQLPRSARKTSPSTISRLRRGPGRKELRTASVELALAIERATGGLVKAHELPLSPEAKRTLRMLRPPTPPMDPEGDGAAA
jgi:hypothetical protein